MVSPLSLAGDEPEPSGGTPPPEQEGWYMPFGCSDGATSDPSTTLFCIGALPVGPDQWLMAGYLIAIGLLLMYFMCEHSWIHRTRRVENVYIIFMLTFVQFFGFIEFHWRGIRVGAQPAVFATDCFRHLLSIMLFAYLVQVHASYSRLARFGGSGRSKHHSFTKRAGYNVSVGKLMGVAGRSARTDDDHTTYHAVRVTEEIENLVEDVLANFRRSDSWVLLSAYSAEILWFICLISNFAWAFKKFTGMFESLLFLFEVFVFGYSWWVGVKRMLLSYLPPVKALHCVIEQLIEYDDAAMIEKVLVNLSVPDLLEAIAFKTLELLTKTALEQGLLTMLSKCVLLDALQKRGLKQRIFAAEAMAILLSCKDRELTLVKNSIDEGGDYHNLYKFMYIDIKDTSIRDSILAHLKEEALHQRRQHRKGIGVKLLSDIDDTLYSSGGHWPAGCDVRYPRNVVYPGCLTLYRLLDRTWTPNDPSCNLVFLSARPHIYKHYSEDVSYGKFKTLHDEGRLHCMPTLLPGELNSGLSAITQYLCKGIRAWKRVGVKKLEMYQKFRELYFEYDFVFFGDNGQGDLWAGEKMDLEQLELRNGPLRTGPEDWPQLLGVCIHRVLSEDLALRCHDQLPKDNSHLMEPQTSADFVDRRSTAGDFVERTSTSLPTTVGASVSEDDSVVTLHSTYVGAAMALHQRNPMLIRATDVLKVVRDAVEEFNSMRLVYADWASNWEVAEHELRQDIEWARTVLSTCPSTSEEAFPELVPTADFLNANSSGSRVFIPAKALVRSNSMQTMGSMRLDHSRGGRSPTSIQAPSFRKLATRGYTRESRALMVPVISSPRGVVSAESIRTPPVGGLAVSVQMAAAISRCAEDDGEEDEEIDFSQPAAA